VVYMGTVDILKNRFEFLEGIGELATLCNWNKEDIEELHHHLLEEIIKIDNLLLKGFDKDEDPLLALAVWEINMEDLRHWLSLVLGVKVKYI